MSEIWLYINKNTSAFGGLHPQILYQGFASGAHCGSSIPALYSFQRLVSLNPRSILLVRLRTSHIVLEMVTPQKRTGFVLVLRFLFTCSEHSLEISRASALADVVDCKKRKKKVLLMG